MRTHLNFNWDIRVSKIFFLTSGFLFSFWSPWNLSQIWNRSSLCSFGCHLHFWKKFTFFMSEPFSFHLSLKSVYLLSSFQTFYFQELLLILDLGLMLDFQMELNYQHCSSFLRICWICHLTCHLKGFVIAALEKCLNLVEAEDLESEAVQFNHVEYSS